VSNVQKCHHVIVKGWCNYGTASALVLNSISTFLIVVETLKLETVLHSFRFCLTSRDDCWFTTKKSVIKAPLVLLRCNVMSRRPGHSDEYDAEVRDTIELGKFTVQESLLLGRSLTTQNSFFAPRW
jgi:hypothetical protein